MTNYNIRSLLTLPADLNRVQHMPSPEGHLSSLAWHEFDSSELGDAKSKQLGYAPNQQSASSTTIFTKPSGSDFQIHLSKHSYKPHISTGNAILNSLNGLELIETRTQTVSPLTPSLALLQNSRGMMGTSKPPDFAAIFEKLFSLGRASENSQVQSVSGLWRAASEHQLLQDPLLRLIDDAIQEKGLTPVGSREDAKNKPAGLLPSVHRPPVFQSSPFGWFYLSWTRLTSDEWVDALPVKVWVDWAMFVMRNAVGFSFLWEATWYHKLADAIIEPNSVDPFSLIESQLEVMPWASDQVGQEVRNVASRMKWKTINAQKLRERINDFFTENDMLDMDYAEALSIAADNKALRQELSSIRQNREGKHLVWEAVTASLTIRDAHVGSSDYYGFWKKNGPRITLVEPATEWLAAMASLSSERPKSVIRLGEIMKSLRSLGLRPAVGDVVALLERAGLARGSDDADLGLKIETAY